MTRAERMNTQSILGTLMLQWLTELVCPLVGADWDAKSRAEWSDVAFRFGRKRGLTDSLLEAAATTGVHVACIDRDTGTVRMSSR